MSAHAMRPFLKGCTHRQIKWSAKVGRYVCAYCGAIQATPGRKTRGRRE